MTQKMRRLATSYLRIDLLFTFVLCILAVIICSVLLVVAIASGEYQRIVPLVGIVTAGLATLGFFYWVSRDSRRSVAELRSKRETEQASTHELGS